MDDDPLKRGAVIGGLKVLGSSEALPTLVPALEGLGHRFAMRCVAVRFGNVLESAGSVIPSGTS